MAINLYYMVLVTAIQAESGHALQDIIAQFPTNSSWKDRTVITVAQIWIEKHIRHLDNKSSLILLATKIAEWISDMGHLKTPVQWHFQTMSKNELMKLRQR